MTDHQQNLLTQLGFRFGTNGPHAARTMMLDDLRLLLAHTSPDALKADYAKAVVEENILGKPTKKSRELAFRHLTSLYGLAPENALFRALRRLWASNDKAQPLLALAVALARDPLLRGTAPYFLSRSIGDIVKRETVEELLSQEHPDRFSPASLMSFAQNISGTWSSAGFLEGKLRKVRTSPEPTPESLTLMLFLGYLEGRTGQRLFQSEWLQLLKLTSVELDALASVASHRGLLVFMNAGGVKELRFAGYLSPEEERIRQEVSHVI